MSDCGYQQLSVNWKPVSKLLRFWGFAKINKVMPSSSHGRLVLYQTKVKTLGYQTNKLKWKDTLPTSGLYQMEILGGERRSPFCGP